MSDPLSRTLARRLRLERRRKELSLRKLAEASGLSTTTVHQIETGRGSPSLATLQALATTLGVAVGELLGGDPAAGAPAVFQRAGHRPRGRTPGGSIERLPQGLPGQRLHGLVLTLAPGADTGEEAMTHPGQELVFVLAGRCVYDVGGREHAMSAGDSLLLDSRQPHRGRNPGRRDARILLVLYAPEGAVGRHARRRP
jgi:transcriptional regulator with XRE-family HTH domain